MSGGETVEIGRLLAESDWLRRIARGLAADGASADDLVQEVWLASMRCPPRPGRTRGWLRTVIGNAARKLHRSEEARRRRESATARPEGSGGRDTDAVAARLELHARVARVVLDLPEPCRAALLLRFCEGLEPAEIARRLGVPGSTVRSRIARGLALARERLDAAHDGDRKAWLAPLLPLLVPPSPPLAGPGLAAGALLMGAKAKIAIVVVVILLLGAAAWIAADPIVASGPPAAAGEAPAPLAEPAPPDPTLAEAEAPAVPPAASPTAPPTARTGDVRVETNVPGCEVTLILRYYGGEPDPAPHVETADATGFAGFDLPERADALYEAEASAWAENHSRETAKVEDGRATLELVPAFPIEGRVVEPRGDPVEYATVGSDRTSVVTGPDGRFTVYATTEGKQAVRVRHRSYTPALVRLPAPSRGNVVTLDRGLTVSGRVTDADGLPVRGVRITSDSDHTITGPDGAWRLGGFEPGEVTVNCWDRLQQQPSPLQRAWGGGSLTSKRVAAGSANVDFVLFRQWSVLLRVTDEEGRPFRHATVRVSGHAGPSGAVGDDGEIVISGYSGQFTVTVAAPGYAPLAEKLDLKERWSVHEITLRRPVGYAVAEIRARHDDGTIPERVLVSIAGPAGWLPGFWMRPVVLDARGSGRVEGVPPGECFVTLSTSNYAEGYGRGVTEKVTFEAGARRTFDVTIPLGGRIRVALHDPEGREIRQDIDRYRLLDADGKRIPVTFGSEVTESGFHLSGGNGPALTVQPVPPGVYTLEIIARRGKDVLRRRGVRVEPGRTTEVEFVLDD